MLFCLLCGGGRLVLQTLLQQTRLTCDLLPSLPLHHVQPLLKFPLLKFLTEALLELFKRHFPGVAMVRDLSLRKALRCFFGAQTVLYQASR